MNSAIIISHDVDHISPYEHLNDLILPKFIVRALLERYMGYITYEELYKRYVEFLNGKWNYLSELAEFDSRNGISSTFFFAVGNGFGLKYKINQAKPFVDMIVQHGLAIGIHGIERQSVDKMKAERQRFLDSYGYDCSGIRMHYLARDHSMIREICDVGYVFDSSLRGNGSAMRIGNSIHFPLHIMDSDMLLCKKRYQSAHTTAAFVATRERISRLIEAKVDYISVLFHDRYFSDAHSSWRDWYQRVVEWILDQRIMTTNYNVAAERINSLMESTN
jgi:hypothetical protein